MPESPSPTSPSPLPWQLEITEVNGVVVRAQVVDASGAPIITVKSPSPQAMENTRRLTQAVNATAVFSNKQLEDGVINRTVAALHTVALAADPTGAITLKPRILKALTKLVSLLPSAKSVKNT